MNIKFITTTILLFHFFVTNTADPGRLRHSLACYAFEAPDEDLFCTNMWTENPLAQLKKSSEDPGLYTSPTRLLKEGSTTPYLAAPSSSFLTIKRRLQIAVRKLEAEGTRSAQGFLEREKIIPDHVWRTAICDVLDGNLYLFARNLCTALCTSFDGSYDLEVLTNFVQISSLFFTEEDAEMSEAIQRYYRDKMGSSTVGRSMRPKRKRKRRRLGPDFVTGEEFDE